MLISAVSLLMGNCLQLLRACVVLSRRMRRHAVLTDVNGKFSAVLVVCMSSAAVCFSGVSAKSFTLSALHVSLLSCNFMLQAKCIKRHLSPES